MATVQNHKADISCNSPRDSTNFDLIEEIRSSLSLIVPIESLLMKEKSLGEDQDSFAVNQTIVDTQRCVNAMNN